MLHHLIQQEHAFGELLLIVLVTHCLSFALSLPAHYTTVPHFIATNHIAQSTVTHMTNCIFGRCGQSASLPEVREEGDDQPPPHTSGCSTTPRRRHHTSHARPSSPPTPSPQRQRHQQPHEQANISETGAEQQESSSLAHQEPARPSTLKVKKETQASQ